MNFTTWKSLPDVGHLAIRRGRSVATNSHAQITMPPHEKFTEKYIIGRSELSLQILATCTLCEVIRRLNILYAYKILILRT